LVDEDAVLCARSNGDGAVKKFGEYGWLHVIGTNTMSAAMPITTERRLTELELHAKFAPLARSVWRNQSESVARLAKQLGVAHWALDQLRVGYGEHKGIWSYFIPELNHSGLIVGLSRRFSDGSKRCVTGSKRGLVYAETWAEYPGPAVIVEGASDAAALLTLGLCVIGRPSNVGGAKYLAGLLAKQAERAIVVIGERDRKRHDDLPEFFKEKHRRQCSGCSLCWPGKHGAKSTAERLRKAIGGVVRWVMCPDGAKDPRAWLNKQEADVEDAAVAGELGRAFLGKLGWRA
jgi:hypothetical protein